jgi:hypothetical protein
MGGSRLTPVFNIGYIDSDGRMQYHAIEYDDAFNANEAKRSLERAAGKSMFVILKGFKGDRLSSTHKSINFPGAKQ